ncbi:MAG: 50S ribosomal protein L4 [Candidatus Yanofskybacteria bacterium GW2011_GWF1_44_227]|uniref:Large ribosomal subunit protein uL4 n=1 Tax=Candidatus Yanofskybacteria bacterium GW2011_GWE2_40_11 TaxID=1619033 RepID=A0A0G0SZ38_9BACT|nr:MAG: 50S ribosomal protein L4 [Candidatus Yanofskybacteria bacterium GW2011_GWE1_40_10]KKR40085.1 MAG: 50S ribosomal protein L4 [Candidatus Yanofskybacteria bacterium GW2011_GWE2_40_11]KKT14764.1 MAG: 50S ribosomal protein L4 [Candidatus Yanofskybacteria bacterium GW2011_GWF2_43_596]KKT52851.1 MAG: 50S ribosomal protein L4 [Candidatus Yanofskybacteria bacterium GW2011_GWF1_44_227]OGN35643.1 MAG: 50S ribosomal protein L4 [Candidatus Yanofskybacteria bacterium RIFOXYA1_FULL_44_17]OGN36680.1 M
MEAVLYNQKGDNIGTVDLPKEFFGVAMSEDLLHQVVVSQMANQRQVIAHAKGRDEVRGGGKKPWKQKGTGRARHGSIRSPIWKGGGATHGPRKEKDYSKKINAKMAQKAFRVALSAKLRDGQIFIVDELKLEVPKTREVTAILKNMSKNFENARLGSTLMVSGTNRRDLVIASGNLKNVDTIESRNLNALKVLTFKNIIMTKDSIEKMVKSTVK